jgi:hypothetical protein
MRLLARLTGKNAGKFRALMPSLKTNTPLRGFTGEWGKTKTTQRRAWGPFA